MRYDKDTQAAPRHQAGFTLIEVVMVLLVGGMIMAAATMTIGQIWSNHSRNTAHMMAVKQVENALHFLQRDVNMAQTVQTTGLSGDEVLKVRWITWDATSNEVIYTWSSDNHRLIRTQTMDGATTTVAYSVEPRPVFTAEANRVIVDMTARVQNSSETRVVEIVKRAGS